MLSYLVDDMPLEPALREDVKRGNGSFVFREDGSFIVHEFFVDPDEESPRGPDLKP